MKTLHELLGDLITIASDVNDLKTVLHIVEHSNEAREDELRATINMTLLHLSAIQSTLVTNVNVLDNYLLEQWHKDPSTMPR